MNEPSVELLYVFVDVKIDVCVDFQAYDVTSRNYKKPVEGELNNDFFGNSDLRQPGKDNSIEHF